MVMEQLDELYRDVILEHFKHSSHSGELPDAQIHSPGVNPLCGDEVTFHLKMDGGRIALVRFQGKGCAISQAASSMLAGALEGKTVKDAHRLIEAMKALMQGEEPNGSVDLGDLEALAELRLEHHVRLRWAFARLSESLHGTNRAI